MSRSGKRLVDFYQELAPLYHLKVDWGSRRKKEQALFDHLFSRRQVTSVLDLGCGDGGHSEEISERGAHYVGIDSSSRMVNMARLRYGRLKEARFLRGNMLALPAKFSSRFDLVLLLGNTLPHLQNRGQLVSLLKGVSSAMKADGRFVVQTVNPELLQSKRLHFLPAKLAADSMLFTPFYVRNGTSWDFYMPIYSLKEGRLIGSRVLETRLKFWRLEEINAEARKAHLALTEKFGDAALSSYAKNKSENMILIFERMAHA